MFERFTDKARAAVVRAQQEARQLQHDYIGTEHLLLGLLADEGGYAMSVLEPFGVTLGSARAAVLEVVGMGVSVDAGAVPFTPRAKKVFEYSLREALALGDSYIGTEHLLLGVLRDTEGVGSAMLSTLGVDAESAREAALAVLQRARPERTRVGEQAGAPATGGEPEVRGRAKKKQRMLDQYAANLTAAAAAGELDPVIGREVEIDRMMRTLARRSKNNPVLVGQPGVGKSAVVEGLAQRLVAGDVPARLQGLELFSLDLAGMVAGARYRGDFEERLKGVLAELDAHGSAIAFIDELHSLIGAGGGEGTMDAANMLKPALARGKLRLIGATTREEYRKYIEKDAALERRFAPIVVEPASVTETVDILTGLRERLEEHHGVAISDAALAAAARLSDRYVNDRQLPDKALDLVDEAAARVGLLGPRTDVDLTALSDVQRRGMLAGWRDGDGPRVDVNEIAVVLSEATGIPVGQLSAGERESLLTLEDSLSGRVIGQHVAVSALARAVRRTFAGLRDPRRPAGSFIFAGPTGVGKAQPLTSKVLTPSGWSTMGEMTVGSVVSTPDGGTASVDGVFPQGVRDVYTIRFADGREVEASDEHLWKVYGYHLGGQARKLRGAKTWKIITTLELKERLENIKGRSFSVELVKPIVFDEASEPLPIDPYLLGLLLGDGCFSPKTNVKLTTADEEIATYAEEILNLEGMTLSRYGIDYSIKMMPNHPAAVGSRSADSIVNPIKSEIRDMGLLGKTSEAKFVPESYLLATPEQRLSILQGLLDSDGTVSVNGTVQFTSVSEQLARDVQELVWSLGGVARITARKPAYQNADGERVLGKLAFTVSIRYHQPRDLFRLTRKRMRASANYQYGATLQNVVKAVTFSRREEVQCIHLDNEEHLYITDGYTVTHNTELAKALAHQLFGTVDALLTLDMSEYSEKHTVARLFGSPPGYVGHEDGGQLTEAVRRRPFSVVLFDEIEKAHPEVFNSLLQVLEEGRLTDASGRSVDFTNTVIVFTTNLGSRDLARGVPVGFASADAGVDASRRQAAVEGELKSAFRPEFLNRIDEVVVFAPLTRSDMTGIVSLFATDLADRAGELGVTLQVTDAALGLLADRGFDPQLGARPLRRVMQRLVEDPLSEKLLLGEYGAGDTVCVDAAGTGEDAQLLFAAVERPVALDA